MISLRFKLAIPVALGGALGLAFALLVWMPEKKEEHIAAFHKMERARFDYTIQTLTEPLLGMNLAQVFSLLDYLRTQHPEWMEIELENALGNTIYPLNPRNLSDVQGALPLQGNIVYHGEKLGRLTILLDSEPALKEIQSEIDEMVRVLIVSGLSAMLLIILMNERFFRLPIILLAEASKRLGAGDYAAQLPKETRDELGQLISAFRMMRDARQNAEQSLRFSKAQTSAVLASSPLVLLAMDNQGIFTLCEGKGLDAMKVGPETVIGRHVFDVFGEGATLTDHFFSALSGRVVTSELPIRDRWYEIHMSPAVNAEGETSGALCVALDITARRRDDEQLRLAAKVFESTSEGMMITDMRSRILTVNQAFTTVTGYTAAEAVGQTPKLLSSKKHDKDFYKKLWDTVHVQGYWQGEIWNRRKNGEIYPEWLTISTVKNKFGEPTHYVGAFTDITERLKATAEIERLAYRDPLTGLPNRRLLIDRFSTATALARREANRLAMFVIDLDRFKQVNDSLGHNVGDKILIEIAARLTPVLRQSDTLSRQGGDEFILLFSQMHDMNEAAVIARRILHLINSPIDAAGHLVAISPSIGVAFFPEDGEDFDTLLKNSDTAMYRAKEHGRNTFRFYDPAMNAHAELRLRTETNLRNALSRNEFELHFQPQIDFKSGRIKGAEVLLRWRQEDQLILPSQFIPILEDTGLIVSVGAWIIRETCRYAHRWRNAGITLDSIAVNVSPLQIRRGNLVDITRAALEDSELTHGVLEFELTESTLIQDMEQVMNTIERLRQLGVRIAIGNFGTGYSNINYLKRLSASKLKIDRSFVSEIARDGDSDSDSDSDSILCAIIDMARALKLRILAEGVETEEQMDRMRALNCDELQGMWISKPLPPAEFEKFYTTWSPVHAFLPKKQISPRNGL